MTGLVPVALTETDLPMAELACARLDGELFSLAGSWCPIDALDGPETRAGAIQPAAPRRAAAERLTAAWIYGLVPEPTVHQFCVDIGARTRNPPGATVHLREVRLDRADAVRFGSLLVTSPLRTAVDLARWGEAPGHPADPVLIAALLARAGVGGADSAGMHPSDPGAASLAGPRGRSFTRIAERALEDALKLLARA